jgi:DNA (cytosine-5)-methyltransferase 1
MEGTDAVGMPNWENRQSETEIQEGFEHLEMAKNKFRWYEFFAGGGMARLGLGPRWNCIFANEWCEKKARAYRAYYGESPELKVEDVRSLTVQDLPGHADLVWASFPCQDLSLAGSGAGLAGERSGTFTPYWKLMRGLISQDRKPRVVVLENVVGTITSHAGRDFTTLIRTIAESGYVVGAVVINAVHFLPQSRPRLFLIAVSDEEKLPVGLTSVAHSKFWHSQSLLKAYFDLPANLRKNWVWWNLPEPRAENGQGLSAIIENDPKGIVWHSKEETERLISMVSGRNKEKLVLAQREGNLKVGTVYKRTRPISRASNAKRVQRAEIRFDDISGCLRTPVGGSSRQIIVIVEGKKVRSRLLSPREAARLMGVPEDYPLPKKYNDAYHLIGDGVAVPVVSWIEKNLLRHLVQLKALEQVA